MAKAIRCTAARSRPGVLSLAVTVVLAGASCMSRSDCDALLIPTQKPGQFHAAAACSAKPADTAKLSQETVFRVQVKFSHSLGPLQLQAGLLQPLVPDLALQPGHLKAP